MMDLWRYLPYKMNPVIFQIGSFSVRWYGIMYLVAFSIVYLLTRYRLKKEKLPYAVDMVSDGLIWAIVGLIIGARVGYSLFYNFSYYLSNPLEIILPFSFRNGFRFTGLSGMSYHGGVIGVIVALMMFCKKRKINFFNYIELLIPSIPLGYTFGRLGNFINGELYGRPTNFILGMYFPGDPGVLRHPSQLYEAFFEGIVLFLILWPLRSKKLPVGYISSFYLLGYGTFRFFIEFVREPDAHIGYFFGWMTEGQILNVIMIFAGLVILFYFSLNKQK
jgi:phosphatidylglycerol:prolipoprotein diacylglycerol transferase